MPRRKKRFEHSKPSVAFPRSRVCPIFLRSLQRKKVETLARAQILKGHLTEEMVGKLGKVDEQTIARAALQVHHIDVNAAVLPILIAAFVPILCG